MIDNADKDIALIKTGNISPGDHVEAGTYYVNYNAEDKSGNKAEQCTVKLSVEGNSINVILHFISKGEFNMTSKFI